MARDGSQDGEAGPQLGMEFLRGDAQPLLRWLMFAGVTAFGFLLLWQFGLIRLMLASDRTYISAVIVLIFLASTTHCLWRTLAITREQDSARRIERIVEAGARGFVVVGNSVVTETGVTLPAGSVCHHIRSLVLKAERQGAHRLDQTLLLRGLADALRRPNGLGGFASDAVLKLGLLGTIVGFIIMLAPIAGLDAADRASMKASMGLMSDGMAVAMYTTLSGLIGSLLIRVQYYMLDEATADLFALASNLTEVFVVSALEREHAAPTVPDGASQGARESHGQLR